MLVLAKGLVIGFLIAAPVGPIGVLCIRRTLANGRLSGVLTGAGAAVADSFYGAVAAFGLTSVSGFLQGYQLPLQILGCLFLLYMGVTTFNTKPVMAPEDKKLAHNLHRKKGLWGDFVSTAFLTLTSPATIFSFMAVFTSLGFAALSQPDYYMASIMVLGVLLGSFLWWLFLVQSVIYFRIYLNDFRMRWINKISGVILIIFALTILGAIFIL